MTGTKKAKLWTKEYIISLGIVFGVNLTMEMLHSTLAIYGKGLTHSDVYAGMLVTAFTIAALVSRGFMGKLFQYLSIKSVLILGTVLSVAASFGYIIFQEPTLFVLCRVLHGVGFGIASTAAATAISVSLPKSRMLEGIGYSGMVSTISMAVGPSISLSISHSDYLLFNRVFWLTFILTIISLLAAAVVKLKPVGQDKQDEIGSEEDGKLFCPTVVVASVLQFVIAFAQTAVTAFLGLYVIEKGMGNAGIFFAIYAIASFMIRVVMPYLVDKFGEKTVMLVSLLIVTMCFGAIPFAKTIWLIDLLAIPYGCACGMISPMLNVQILGMVSLHQHGAANAVWYAAIDAGIGVGAMAWSAIATAVGYDFVYIIAALLSIFCLIICVRERKNG